MQLLLPSRDQIWQWKMPDKKTETLIKMDWFKGNLQ